MNSIGVEVKGIKEIEAKFEKLSQLDRIKFFTAIFNPVGSRIVREMRAEAPPSERGATSKKYPSRTHPAGTLRRSIGKGIGGTDIPTLWVSPNRIKTHDAYYTHMVVGGHELGSSTVAPNPFVRRTWEKMQSYIKSECKKLTEVQLKSIMR